MYGRSIMTGLTSLVAVLGVPWEASSQAPALAPRSFIETLEGKRPVVGNPFWGLHLGSGTAPADILGLSLTIPPSVSRLLCIQVETQDGRYQATAMYDLPGSSAVLSQKVDFPTKYAADLRSYSIRDVGVRAYLAADCTRSRNQDRSYVPIQWPDGTAPAGHYLLLANARTPGVDLSIFHRESKRDFECTRDTLSKSHLAFDTECAIYISPGQHAATIIMVRRHMEERTETELRIYFP